LNAVGKILEQFVEFRTGSSSNVSLHIMGSRVFRAMAAFWPHRIEHGLPRRHIFDDHDEKWHANQSRSRKTKTHLPRIEGMRRDRPVLAERRRKSSEIT
jgi:hypothetical protein